MKFGFPWSAKEIPPQARVTAEEAARRAGMSLSDWLNSVINQQAAHAGVQTPPVTDDDFHSGHLAAMNDRLDDLARRVEQLARTGPAAYAPKRIRDAADRPADELPPPSAGNAECAGAAQHRSLHGRNRNAPAHAQ